MARIEKTVFISYRRKDISWALAVYQYLSGKNYDVFFDFSSIPSGDFEQIIVSNIKARAHFILILTPTALDRSGEPGDWLRREIETAIDEKRNIIPLFFDGFNFGSPSVAEKLTGKLSTIRRYNGLDIPSGYFTEAMERLRGRYLNVSLNTVIHPVTTEVRKVVKEEQVAVEKALEQKKEDIEELVKPAEEILEEAATRPFETQSPLRRESVAPVESVKKPQEIKEEGPESESKEESSENGVGKLREEFDHWRRAVDELKKQHADSALLISIDQSMDQALALFEKEDLPGTVRILAILKSTIEKAQQELNARDSAKEQQIDAQLGSDGRLIFRQAASYQPIEVLLEGFGRGKPGEIIAYSKQGEYRQPFEELRGSDIAYNVMSGKATPVATRELGGLLGTYLNHVLSPLDRSSSIQYRLRITATNQEYDAFPWELAIPSAISSEPLGLNPRYSVVRGSITSSYGAKSLERFQPKLLVIYPRKNNQLEGRINALKRLQFPYSVRYLESEDQDDVYAVITNEKPLLVHTLGYLDRSGSSSSGASTSISGMKSGFSYQGLKISFDSKDVGLLMLDTVGGIGVAGRVAAAGVSIQAWNSGYSPEAAQAFYNSFYPALLRSGQPEFAITEGRRAIAATFGQESYLAVSPVLYVGGEDSKAL
jgi:hypothetical protein